jgi:hypothetical protein
MSAVANMLEIEARELTPREGGATTRERGGVIAPEVHEGADQERHRAERSDATTPKGGEIAAEKVARQPRREEAAAPREGGATTRENGRDRAGYTKTPTRTSSCGEGGVTVQKGRGCRAERGGATARENGRDRAGYTRTPTRNVIVRGEATRRPRWEEMSSRRRRWRDSPEGRRGCRAERKVARPREERSRDRAGDARGRRPGTSSCGEVTRRPRREERSPRRKGGTVGHLEE